MRCLLCIFLYLLAFNRLSLAQGSAPDTINVNGPNQIKIEYPDHTEKILTYDSNGLLVEESYMYKRGGVTKRINTYYDSVGVRSRKHYSYKKFLFFRKQVGVNSDTVFTVDNGPLIVIERRKGKGNYAITFYTASGNVYTYANYSRHKLDGPQYAYYFTNILQSELVYAKGRLRSAKYFDISGDLLPNDDFKDGDGLLIKYSYGTESTRCEYKNGKEKQCRDTEGE